MTLKQTKQKGFTIVELLIVVVIIAILAAITVVAYNGIQARANNAASQSAANTVMKKIEAYNAINTGYPNVTTAAALTTALNGDPTTTLTGTGITVTAAAPNQGNGKTTVRVTNCGSGSGAQIFYFDYQTGAMTTTPLNVGTAPTSCVAYTA